MIEVLGSVDRVDTEQRAQRGGHPGCGADPEHDVAGQQALGSVGRLCLHGEGVPVGVPRDRLDVDAERA